MKKKLLVALAAASLAVIPASAAMADSHTNAEIVIVHGVPGLEVDVFAGGDALLEGFNYTDIEVASVPAGSYDLAVAPAGEGVDAAVLGPLTAQVEAGMSYSVVAHLDADGNPTASVFVNNAGEGISAFHTAAFPAVAIVAGGEIAADDLTNGNDAQLDLEGGTELPGVGIAAAGSTDLAIELGDITIPDGQRILAYAIGPDEGAEIPEVVTQVIDVDVEAPTHVDAGSAGLATQGLPLWVAGLMLLGAAGLAAPAVATARRRS